MPMDPSLPLLALEEAVNARAAYESAIGEAFCTLTGDPIHFNFADYR